MTTDQTARYRNRTAEVEAVQWTGNNAEQLRAFMGADFYEIDSEDRAENPAATAAMRESKHGTWCGLEPGDWVVKLDEGFYEFSAADFAERYEPAVSAPVPPPVSRAALRDRIAEAMREHHLLTNREEADAGGNFPCRCGDWREPGPMDGDEYDWDSHLADAVLAVLPAPADRADVLRELEHRYREHARYSVHPDFQAAYTAVANDLSYLRHADDERAAELAADQPPAPNTPGTPSAVPQLLTDQQLDMLDTLLDEIHGRRDAAQEIERLRKGSSTGPFAIVSVPLGLLREGAEPAVDRATVRARSAEVREQLLRRMADEEQPGTEARTVCVCGHTRADHATVNGRLLCDECVPDSTENLVCKEFEAL